MNLLHLAGLHFRTRCWFECRQRQLAFSRNVGQSPTRSVGEGRGVTWACRKERFGGGSDGGAGLRPLPRHDWVRGCSGFWGLRSPPVCPTLSGSNHARRFRNTPSCKAQPPRPPFERTLVRSPTTAAIAVLQACPDATSLRTPPDPEIHPKGEHLLSVREISTYPAHRRADQLPICHLPGEPSTYATVHTPPLTSVRTGWRRHHFYAALLLRCCCST
jgi:hypothetical protein